MGRRIGPATGFLFCFFSLHWLWQPHSEKVDLNQHEAPSSLGVSLSVCALVSNNNPNHFSPMLSPPARSGRYTPLLCSLFSSNHFFRFLFFSSLLFCLFLYCRSCLASLSLCLCQHFYMEIPCLHHMGHIASFESKKKLSNLTKMQGKNECNCKFQWKKGVTKKKSCHWTVAHVCIWPWKLLTLCFSFLSLAVWSLHSCVLLFFCLHSF